MSRWGPRYPGSAERRGVDQPCARSGGEPLRGPRRALQRRPPIPLLRVVTVDAEAPGPAPAQWRHLYDLSAREAFLGPLAGAVRVALYDRGVGVGADDEVFFAYQDVVGLPGGDRVELREPGTAQPRHVLTGKGARILHKLLGILDDARRVPVVGAHADGLSPVGLPIRGIALGGAKGIVLIPGGLVGLVPNASLRLSLASVDAAVWRDGGLRLEVSGDLDPRVSIRGDHLTPTTFGDWWAAALGPPGSTEDAPLEVLWADDHEVLSPGRLELVDGGLVLRSTRGTERVLRSAGLWLEADARTTVAGGAVRMRLRVRGVTHRIWLRGGLEDAVALADHLSTCRLSAWPEDFDARTWRRCVGRWSAARVLVPGKDELVLRSPVVVSVPTGLVVCCERLHGTRQRPLPRGRRVKVELLDDRAGLGFTSIVLDQASRCLECGGCEDRNAGQVLALFPIGEPERRTSRRARHRIDVVDEVPVQLRQDSPRELWRGLLHNLSAEGAGVVLDGPGPPLGSVVELRMPIDEAGVVQVCAETLHTTPDGPDAVRLGLRFTYPTERVRSLFQREVLRFERRALALSRKEGVPTEDDGQSEPTSAPPAGWSAEGTVDLT